MEWTDIAGIVFVCVTVNHLGLIATVESIVGTKLPIINCVKCLTFWATLTYSVTTSEGVTKILAISFLASYSALWLELLEGFIDKLYMKLYEKIITAGTYDTASSDADDGYSAGSVSEL